MSRIGRMPIAVPAGVTVKIDENLVTVTGPKGELSRQVSPEMAIAQDNGTLTVTRPSDNKEHRSLHGLTRSLVANMIQGVSSGFDKYLEIVGVGYRAEKTGEKLTVRVGYSHPVEVAPLPGISFG
jgi:large subunit ribosomal protein L6